ncbi:hypothetical protein BS17DRAFT_472074 [Gyrodon lividus]|nr:hypothetical protein BS17DRAFT_472074 [Gyrodon lividus]
MKQTEQKPPDDHTTTGETPSPIAPFPSRSTTIPATCTTRAASTSNTVRTLILIVVLTKYSNEMGAEENNGRVMTEPEVPTGQVSGRRTDGRHRFPHSYSRVSKQNEDLVSMVQCQFDKSWRRQTEVHESD